MPEDEQIETHFEALAVREPAPIDSAEISPEHSKPRGIAPIWHTLVLVIAILAYSVWGAIGARTGTTNPIAPPSGGAHAASAGVDHVRLIRYALTGALELGIVVWVAFGMRLRKVPFRTLFGVWPRELNSVTMEILVAAAFWVCSMIILALCALAWLGVQNHIYKQQTAAQSSNSSESGSQVAKPKSPEQQQAELIRHLTEIAPANGIEIAAWGLLCLVVGFSEEVIFRGYLQSQGIAILRNGPVAVVGAAIVFGAAHGYQGARGVFLISVFGVLFGIITRMRRSLLPGMIAHAWQDFFVGLLLALLRANPQLLEQSLKGPK
jgi:membrane protease YdiL (CAAX protease family)